MSPGSNKLNAILQPFYTISVDATLDKQNAGVLLHDRVRNVRYWVIPWS